MTVTALEKPDPAAKQPPIMTLRGELEARAAEFATALPSHISPEKFQRTILTAVQKNPELLAADRRSFLTACMKAAHDALLPDGDEAAIVIFKTRLKDAQGRWDEVKLAQYMPMVRGLRKKILQSGEIKDLYTNVVYRQEIEAARFIYEEGSERTLRHKPLLDMDFKPRDDDVALAYSIATYQDGSQSYEVLRRWEIDEIREVSQTGATLDRRGDPRDPKGPWVEWFGEMAKKSVVRRHAKSLPQSGDRIIDVEAEDMGLAARSSVALLASRQPDQAKPLMDEIAGPRSETIDSNPRDPTLPEPEQPPQRPKPQPDVQPQPEPDDIPGDAPEDQLTEPPQAPPIEPPTDQMGVTETPDEQLANEIIHRASLCELLIDLITLERETAVKVASMEPDIARFVDQAFIEARQRLTPVPAAT